MGREGTAAGHKYSPMTFSKVFTHASLFGIQSIIFTMPNAIYHTVFVLIGILKEDEQDKTSDIVGYLSGAFFLGKLISDPIWGVVRDKMGDKNSLTLITLFLFVTLILFGFSRNLLQMCITIAFIGLASGVYVPGTSFMNWIEPHKRDYLAMWVYIFAGAGALVGPFAGSLLITYMPKPKIIMSYGLVGVIMVLMTIWFLIAFWNFDDRHLIEMSEYSKMEDDERNLMFRTELQEKDKINRTAEKRLSAKSYKSGVAHKNNISVNEDMYSSASKVSP